MNGSTSVSHRTVLTGVMMTPEERQALEDLAKSLGLNKSDTIRLALRRLSDVPR